MKKLLTLLLATSFLFQSCEDKKKENATETPTEMSEKVLYEEPQNAIADAVANNDVADNESAPVNNDAPEIYFENFCVPVVHPGESMPPLDWSSYPEAKMFKTRITEAYKTGEIDFAGHFITAIFGCGADCIMGFMIDAETGKIYNLPLGESNMCSFAEDKALYNKDSRLFISSICREDPESTNDVYYKAFLWDEDAKDKDEWKFISVESDTFLTKKECDKSRPKRLIHRFEDE